MVAEGLSGSPWHTLNKTPVCKYWTISGVCVCMCVLVSDTAPWFPYLFCSQIHSYSAPLLLSFRPLHRMGATVFVQPLDLVKNRMQLSGQGSKAREYKTSGHALISILRNEGLTGIYTGYVCVCLCVCACLPLPYELHKERERAWKH